MTPTGGDWEASAVVSPGPSLVALFVDATDEVDGTVSYASSTVQLLAR